MAPNKNTNPTGGATEPDHQQFVLQMLQALAGVNPQLKGAEVICEPRSNLASSDRDRGGDPNAATERLLGSQPS